MKSILTFSGYSTIQQYMLSSNMNWVTYILCGNMYNNLLLIYNILNYSDYFDKMLIYC